MTQSVKVFLGRRIAYPISGKRANILPCDTVSGANTCTFIAGEYLSPAGNIDALTASPIASVSTVGTPTLGQVHALFGVAIASASTVDVSTFGQKHVLTANGVSSASTVGNPALSQGVALTANPIASVSTVGTPSLGQVHALFGVAIASASSVDTVTLHQIYALTVNALSSVSSVGSPALGQVHGLFGVGISSDSSVGSGELGIIYNFTTSEVYSHSFVGNPSLTNSIALVADAVYAESTVGKPTLTEVSTASFGKVLIGGVWADNREGWVLVNGVWKSLREVHVVAGGAWKLVAGGGPVVHALTANSVASETFVGDPVASEIVVVPLYALQEVEVSMLCFDGSDGKGNAFQLTAIGADASNLSPYCTWTTSDASKATVSAGLVSAVSGGTGDVTITASFKGVSFSCLFTVFATMPDDVTLYTLKGGKGKDIVGNNSAYLCYFSNEYLTDLQLLSMRFNGKSWTPPLFCTYAAQYNTTATYLTRMPMIYLNNPCVKEETTNATNRTIKNQKLNVSLSGLNTMDLAYDRGGYWYNGAYRNSDIVLENEGPYSIYHNIFVLIFTDQLQKAIRFSHNQTLVAKEDLLDRTKSDLYYVPQNYIRYYDRGAFSKQTIIPNIGVLGSYRNVKCDVTPDAWF